MSDSEFSLDDLIIKLYRVCGYRIREDAGMQDLNEIEIMKVQKGGATDCGDAL
jgi:hypothetical protein